MYGCRLRLWRLLGCRPRFKLLYGCRYFDDNCQDRSVKSGTQPVPAALLSSQLETAYNAGASGIILWDCPKFENRTLPEHGVTSVLQQIAGPVVRSVITRASRCATTACSGHGRCSKLPAAQLRSFHLQQESTPSCNCTLGWLGATCNHSADATL